MLQAQTIRGIRFVSRYATVTRRTYHPEPRSLQNSAHASHRALYRWTAQAFGVPFLVAYLCDKVSEKSSGEGSSWKLDLSQIEANLLTEPIKINTQVWGQMRHA